MDIDTKNLEAFKKVVLAGMKLMYDPKTFKLFANGIQRQDVPLPELLAQETAGLIKMLMDKSQNKIPPHIIMPAATMLLMEIAKFMKDAGIASPGKEDIQKGTMLMMELIKGVFPVGEQQAPAPAQPQGGLIAQGA